MRVSMLMILGLLISTQIACMSTGKKKKKLKKQTLTHQSSKSDDLFSSALNFSYEKGSPEVPAVSTAPSTRRAHSSGSVNLWKGFSDTELQEESFTMKAVQKVTSKNSWQVAECYSQTKTRETVSANIENNILISYSINGEGKVVSVETLASPFSKHSESYLNSCLMKKMVSWKFPGPDQDLLTIEQPFRFDS